MRINTQRRLSVVHSHPGIRALYLLNKPVTSFHNKLSLGRLLLHLTNRSWEVLYALHLSLFFICQHYCPPQTKTTVPNSPMHYGDTLYWKLFGQNLLFPGVKEDKTQPSTTHQAHHSTICYSKMPICPTIDKSTGTLEKDYQIVVFYYTKQIQFKDN